MNGLLGMLGHNIFGNLWTTVPGGYAVFQLVMPVLNKISSGATVGEIVLSPEFAGLAAGIQAILGRDPKILSRG